MRTTALAAMLALAAFSHIACNGGAPGVRLISQDTLLGEPPDGVVILDVRTEAEYASGHVPDAVNIPHDELAARLAELGAETSAPIVVYCERGGRATAAEGVLLDAGYANVLHLEGDMSAWRASGRPTEKP
jgi:rhodanese-related sulfurtransferase